MIDFGILKASGLKYFIQCFDKNFTPSQEKKENKVVVSAKTSIPAKELGHINIKGIFSLFKAAPATCGSSWARSRGGAAPAT